VESIKVKMTSWRMFVKMKTFDKNGQVVDKDKGNGEDIED